MAQEQPELKRTLTLTQLTCYGIGTILGAGIYVLIGAVAGEAGTWAPLAFVIAAVLAGITGLSFAELSSRFPFSAGEAVYMHRAFGSARLSQAVGFLVVLTGVVSSATLVSGFAGYFAEFARVPDIILIPSVCIVLGGIAAWGILQSVGLAVALTALEIIGLAIVVGLALPDAVAGQVPVSPSDPVGAFSALGVLTGAGLAFYAFIGFEDMVNVAEEVKGVRRNMPRAIILALVVTTVIYAVVAIVAVRAMPIELLAVSNAPLADIAGRQTAIAGQLISAIALFAVLNSALIQVIMAARVIYGAAAEGWVPKALGHVHPKTQTPLVATGLATGAVVIFALWLPLTDLARLTSLIILVIFAFVNVALWRIKRGAFEVGADVFVVPVWIPISGAVSCAVFVLVNLYAFSS